MVELMHKAGLQGVSLHSLRYSHATSPLSKGVPNAVVTEPADTCAVAKLWNDAMADVIEETQQPRKPAC